MTHSNAAQPTAYSPIKDLCELFSISRTSFWRLSKQPDFPSPIRIGRAVRWDAQAVEAFLLEKGAN